MSKEELEQLRQDAIKRWKSKGLSKAMIQALLRHKEKYIEPRKARYREANDDKVFALRCEVDDVVDRMQTERALKEVWDEKG